MDHIAFRKVERHAHDNTRSRSPTRIPFELGMESDFGQQPRLGFTTLIASAQDGDPPATRRFGHLTSADSRESEIAAAPKHRSRRRDARMHRLRVRHSGCVARECRLQQRLF